jgi:predicted metal-dependent phosphotriesterase family hydrolase
VSGVGSPLVVRTVLGDIAPEKLGVTACHEHLWCDQFLCREPDFPRQFERMRLNDIELVVREVSAFVAAGGRALMEMTVPGWGRDVGVMAEIARRTDLHVVATSGYYVEACLPGFARNASIADLTDALVREMTCGADGTSIRPGILKASVTHAVLEGVEERCSRAVARAHHRTGACITTHTTSLNRFQIDGGNAGTQFLDLFEDEGVDLNRVIIGHCDANADLRQLGRLMDRGAYVQFDILGKRHWLLDETRADLMASLLARGYGARLLLSTDRNRLSELHVSGGPGYDHAIVRFLPMLQERGVTDQQIQAILVTNPARIFALPATPPEAAAAVDG